MRKILELRQERSKLIVDARAINDAAKAANREMTEEEARKFDELMDLSDGKQTEIDKLVKKDEQQKRLDAAQASLERRDDPQGGGAGVHRDDDNPTRTVIKFLHRAPWSQREIALDNDEMPMNARPAYRRAWAYYYRSIAAQREHPEEARKLMAKVDAEMRSMQADISTAGGFLVPPLQFIADLIAVVDDQVFIRQLATVQTLTTAASLGVPTRDTDIDDAEWTSELSVGAEAAGPSIGRRDLTPHPLAKYTKLSNKLIRAAAIDPETLLRDRLAYKFGVAQEKAFMTGSGAQQPLGLFTASANGIPTSQDKGTGSATGFLGDNLIDAKYALKPQYWPRARWLFHRNAIASIRKLKDSVAGQYLWNPGSFGGQGLIRGAPDTLLDLPITISEFCPGTLTSALYVGMLADFSQYWIVDALDMTLQRLGELFALTNQTGFIGRMELDAMPVVAEAFIRLKTS